LTASAFAADPITITGSYAGGKVTIGWSGTFPPLGAAVVLDAGTSGVTFTGYSAASADSFFDVFIDYAYAAGTAYTLGSGNPIANPNAAGAVTLPATKITLCVGHLAAASNGSNKLADVDVSGTGTVTVALDTLRGGVVNGNGLMTVTLPAPIPVGGATCLGDLDGDGAITFTDLVSMIVELEANGFNDIVPPTSPATDMDGDGAETFTDLVSLIVMLEANGFNDIACP